MKKTIKVSAATAIALSALTPVAAFAAESAADTGFYTANSYTTGADFRALSTAEKRAILTNPETVLVIGGKVYFAADAITAATNAELAEVAMTEAAFEAQYGELTKNGYDNPEAPVGDLKVESVSATNNQTLEIKLNNAITEDQAEEIEEAANRVVVYTAVQDQTNPTATSTVITFSEDRKTATVILNAPLNTGAKYKVAFVDNNTTPALAKVVTETSSFSELISGLETPEVTPESSQDEYTLTFDKKMNAAAETNTNYTVYDSTNNAVASAVSTAEFVTNSGDKKVKLTVAPGTLQAGKTYTVIVNNTNVTANDGTQLTAAQSKFTIKTPSVTEATPKVAGIQVTGENEITVLYDKDLKTNGTVDTDLISVKKSTGTPLVVSTAAISGKELVITTDSGSELEAGKSYKLEVTANAGINDVYRNVTTTAINTTVKAASNVGVTAVNGKFVLDTTNPGQYDLILTFDQPVNAIPSAGAGDVVINSLGSTIDIAGTTAISKYSKDSTGKSLIIEDVATAFSGLDMEAGKTYEVVVKNGVIETSTATGTPNTNGEDLKTNVTGIDVTAPEVDTTTLVSADKITVKFDEVINIEDLKAGDIAVEGFVKGIDGSITQQSLSGASQLKFSASGDTLTITPANSAVKFVTGDVAGGISNYVTIAANTIKDANGYKNSAITITTVKDLAAPVLLAGSATGTDDVVLTYSEDVDFKATGGSDEEATQFVIGGAEVNGFATAAGASSNEITITLASAFESAKDYSSTTITYTRNTNYQVEDAEGLIAVNGKLTGIETGF
ncbi:Ig-like domain-containing protein [Sporosarcina sp. ACRSM]|uniref:Ig-like domain-containing protein n=1 Tax=Sporosarcina sp. ACRSM TaxID=2918216 RepID=UPI001EF626A0|nr:Ig-like domain-containing protein [Sporosarcina sp. ACRSM]MCG7337383.1 Ig-like domain-containing protein [Sporosarcina sp. ACRSM]